MATTSNTYTGNGSNKLFSITFPYLETTDVDVYLNGTLQTITTQYTFANATTIEFVAAPANGAVVLLNRSTDDATLQATFFPGSSIKAADLNLDFDQVLYIAQETSNKATTATSTAASATTTANTALSQSSAAVSTANTASSNASAAVSTANTASTNASNAVTTANTASSNATTAVNTANAATSTANTASSNASAAVSTANTASSNASAAVSTANTASTNASAAVSTANTASTNASTAVTTANNAVTTANGAVTTANTANTNSNTAVTTANAAAAAVANAVLYTTVANVAAIPGSPANNAAVEVTNSTGIQSFTPLSGVPAGFIGSSGLSVRIIYQTSGATWTWIQYFPNDPETRYLKLAGGTLTGAIENLTVNTGDASIYGVRVGRGLGAISTNTALGNNALNTNTTGSNNTASGQSALYSNTIGYSNTAVGVSALYANTTGYSNVAYGVNALSVNTVGVQNTANGYASLYLNISGNNNTAHGFQALYSNTTGGTNTCYGYNAGNALTTGSNNTIIGSIAGTAGLSDTVIIGAGATERLRIDSSGRVGIGTSSPSAVLDVSGNSKTSTLQIGTNPAGVSIGVLGIPNQKRIYGRNAANTGDVNILYIDGSNGMVFGPGDAAVIDSSGRLGIGTTSVNATRKVEIVQNSGYDAGLRILTDGSGAYNQFFSGASNFRIGSPHNTTALVFDDGATERARIDSSGRLLVGTATARSNFFRQGTTGITPFTQIESAINSYNNGLSVINNSASGFGAMLNLATSYSTSLNSNVIGSANQQVGTINFLSNDGTNFVDCAQIRADVDGTPGANDMPGRLVLSTTSDGAASPTERMRIDSSGAVGFGIANTNINDGTINVAATGTGAGTANTRLFMGGYELTSGNAAGLWFGARNNENTGVIGSRTASGNIAFETYLSGSWGERFRISNNGSLSSVIPGGSTLYPSFGCRAWVNFNGSGGGIRASGNVSSVTVNTTGNYTINFSTAMVDANFSVAGLCSVGGADGFLTILATATGSVQVRADEARGDFNPSITCVSIFR